MNLEERIHDLAQIHVNEFVLLELGIQRGQMSITSSGNDVADV
jgi:hypothetical protein